MSQPINKFWHQINLLQQEPIFVQFSGERDLPNQRILPSFTCSASSSMKSPAQSTPPCLDSKKRDSVLQRSENRYARNQGLAFPTNQRRSPVRTISTPHQHNSQNTYIHPTNSPLLHFSTYPTILDMAAILTSAVRFKLTFFVPPHALEACKTAIFAAGAGRYPGPGNYTECCWTAFGTGQFRPGDTANPNIGEVGRLEEVQEAKVETLCVGEDVARKAVEALKRYG